jgi:ABC-type multidrug transport system ATPase subunit
MMEVADRLYVLQRGRIAISGTPSELGTRLDEVAGAYLPAAPVSTPPSGGDTSVSITNNGTGTTRDLQKGR